MTESIEKFKKEHSLGKDALDFSKKNFEELLKNKKRSGIKSALTDQHTLAGIGNVYADEILYHSKIHPRSKTGSLSEEEIKELYSQMFKN